MNICKKHYLLALRRPANCCYSGILGFGSDEVSKFDPVISEFRLALTSVDAASSGREGICVAKWWTGGLEQNRHQLSAIAFQVRVFLQIFHPIFYE